MRKTFILNKNIGIQKKYIKKFHLCLKKHFDAFRAFLESFLMKWPRFKKKHVECGFFDLSLKIEML